MRRTLYAEADGPDTFTIWFYAGGKRREYRRKDRATVQRFAGYDTPRMRIVWVD